VLIPLVGLGIAFAIFACVCAALLTLIPRLRPTLLNISVFAVAAVPASAISAIAYGRFFGNETGDLNPIAVLGLFVALLLAGTSVGLLSVIACKWLLRIVRLYRDSGSRVSP